MAENNIFIMPRHFFPIGKEYREGKGKNEKISFVKIELADHEILLPIVLCIFQEFPWRSGLDFILEGILLESRSASPLGKFFKEVSNKEANLPM